MSTRPAGDDGRWPVGEADDRLAAVFRAAAAPAHPAELAGEDAAMAAFRAAAVTEPVTEPRRSSTVRNVLAKVLTVKAMVVLAVAGSAGIVVAATGGVLPTPWSAPPVEQRTTAPATATTETAGTTEPGPSSSAETAAPEIVDLCRKYVQRDRRDKVLDNPAFGPLVDAAGGAEKVPAYCAAHAEDTKPGPGHTPPGTPKSHENGKGKDGDDDKGPGDHGRPDNPGNSATPEVPGNNGNPGNPPNPPARAPKETEPRKPENAVPADTPGGSARGAATRGADPDRAGSGG